MSICTGRTLAGSDSGHGSVESTRKTWEYDARCGCTRTRLAWVEDLFGTAHQNLRNDHLSRGGSVISQVIGSEHARQSNLISASQAGIHLGSTGDATLARSTLLCRQCGLAGLDKIDTLSELARCASTPQAFRLLYYFFYGLVPTGLAGDEGKFAIFFSHHHSTTSRASLIWCR